MNYCDTKLKGKLAIIVPYYHSDLSEMEQISLTQMKRKLCNRHFVFLAPYDVDVDSSGIQSYEILRVDSNKMNGVASYNEWLLQRAFYNQFSEYNYILLCQLDVFVFYDNLDYFITLDYDYYGAPWLDGEASYSEIGYEILYVGNGGFSLRKVSKMKSFLKYYNSSKKINEDVYFSSCKLKGLNVAPISECAHFAFERRIQEMYSLTGEMPMAIHAWNRYDLSFLRQFINKEGYNVDSIEDRAHDMKWHSIWHDIDNIGNECIFERIISLVGENKEIVIWGAGNNGNIVGWILKRIGYSFFSYIDGNSEKLHYLIHGKAIDSFQEKRKYQGVYWIICAKGYEREIQEKLLSKGFSINQICNYQSFMNKILGKE